jgi:putative flippase GtrA
MLIQHWLKQHSFIRFLVAGSLNTLATYFIYLLALFFLPYPWAYSLSYLSGILISFVLNTKYVFQIQLNLRKVFRYGLFYIVSYLLGLELLIFLIELVLISPKFASLGVILFMVPFNYVCMRFILKL